MPGDTERRAPFFPRAAIRASWPGRSRCVRTWDARETLEEGTPPLHTHEQTAVAAPRTHWYGWQTLLTDGGALLLLLSSQATAPFGLAGYVLGSPIVHAAHTQWAPAVGSLLLRLTLPVVGALAGIGLASASTSAGSNGGLDAAFMGIIGGGLLGMGAATAIDASLLAWEPERPAPATNDASPAAPSITLAPLLSPPARTDVPHAGPVAGLALVGTF